jgi:DnaJ-class molecular chaperone
LLCPECLRLDGTLRCGFCDGEGVIQGKVCRECRGEGNLEAKDVFALSELCACEEHRVRDWD